MSWHFVERWLQKVNQHSTLIGKFWITFLIVFRIVVVSSVGDRVYSDEQSEFKCNTMQVGCPNICFNKFSPISHIRFWSFQIILVTTPSIIFMVYSAHKIKKKTAKEKTLSSGANPSPSKGKGDQGAVTQWKQYQSDEDNNNKKRKRKKSTARNVSQFNELDSKKGKKSSCILTEDEKAGFSQHYALYTSSVLCRTMVEIFFIYLQYTLFGFNIPELFKCKGKPCPNVVDCFVSRPMEKTIFLWFMFIIAVISLSLNVAEIVYLLYQYGLKRSERRYQDSIKKHLKDMRDITIHDAEIVDGGIIHAGPPDYMATRCLSGGPIPSAPEFVNEYAPQDGTGGLAMSVSLDDAMIVERMKHNGSFSPEFRTTTAQKGPRLRDVITTTNGYDQPYMENSKSINRATKSGKKNNDYYDYV